MSQLLPIACLLLSLAWLGAGVDQPIIYEESANDFVPLSMWLKQRDLQSCLASSPADILFAVDASQSVGLTNFHLVVKSILIDTISRLQVREDGVQVGVLVFSNQVQQIIPIGLYKDKLDLMAAISNIAFVGSYTSMDAAVDGCVAELSRRRVELVANGNEANATERRSIVVFVTDGLGNHGNDLYLKDMLHHLHARVEGVMALGLQGRSNQQMLKQIASNPTLVFQPTTYPGFQDALGNLLNIRCSNICYKYQQKEAKVRKVIATMSYYVNYLINNFISIKRRELNLGTYVQRINSSTELLNNDIKKTCNRNGDKILERIIDLREKISVIQKKISTGNMTGKAFFISELLKVASKMREETFELKHKLLVKQSQLDTLEIQEQNITTMFEARLKSQNLIRKASEESFESIEKRIESFKTQIESFRQQTKKSETLLEELSQTVRQHESSSSKSMKEMVRLEEQYKLLLSVQSKGDSVTTEIRQKLQVCKNYLKNFELVLFAIQCRSGASFTSLFSREEKSFTKEVFEGLQGSSGVYKSWYLKFLHTMGYIPEVTMKFLVSGNVVATLTMDTSSFELTNIFSQIRVTTSYPWVASYINSVYRSSITQFRLHSNSEFLMFFGDLTRYRTSGSCSELVGVYVVLEGPHRCFPEATEFPQVWISTSPYGGTFSQRIDQVWLVTNRLPSTKLLPSKTTTENEVSEVLLYVRQGAGLLQSLLLSDRYTSASVLAEISGFSELSRHYKSSILNKVALDNYEAIVLEIFDISGDLLAELKFQGPFDLRRTVNMWGELGNQRHSWQWFHSQYLVKSTHFDINELKKASFSFYDGSEFFSIGRQLGEVCERRRYFMTVVDRQTACRCFANATTPAILLSRESGPQECEQLIAAQSLRITGYLNKNVRSF